MPTTLTKLATATIVLTLSAVIPGCSCSYSSSTGTSKGTHAPGEGKPINNDGKPAGTSKATSGSQGPSKAVKGGSADDAAPAPEAKPTSAPATNETLSAKPEPEPEPEPVSSKGSGSTFKTAD